MFSIKYIFVATITSAVVIIFFWSANLCQVLELQTAFFQCGRVSRYTPWVSWICMRGKGKIGRNDFNCPCSIVHIDHYKQKKCCRPIHPSYLFRLCESTRADIGSGNENMSKLEPGQSVALGRVILKLNYCFLNVQVWKLYPYPAGFVLVLHPEMAPLSITFMTYIILQ